MKVRLGTLTGSPETGTGSSGMYWNDERGAVSGVSFMDYTDDKGRARRIWPDSDILHIQSIKLALTPEVARQIANFDGQREMLEGRAAGMQHAMTLTVNGKQYSLYAERNTRWDAETNTLFFLRNSGPMPGRIVRGDHATVELSSLEMTYTVQNPVEGVSVLIPNLSPITTCDVTMTAGWRSGDSTPSSDEDRGHVQLLDASGVMQLEVTGEYQEGGGGKKGGGGKPKVWDGTDSVRGISYNGSVKAQGPAGTCTVAVTWPAYHASYTVRVLDVVVG